MYVFFVNYEIVRKVWKKYGKFSASSILRKVWKVHARIVSHQSTIGRYNDNNIYVL